MSPHKFKNGADKPVIALDIDGTLGDYHGHFLRFAEGYCGKVLPSAEKINPGLPLWKHMRVSRSTYRACKLAYRQGGLKRSMPAYPYASELTRAVRRAGAEVWICTTRPYLRLDNIDPDTREWLKRNRIAYDAVLFGDGKYAELVRQVGLSRIVAIADDLPEQIDAALKQNIKNIYLKDQAYNQLFCFDEGWRYHRFYDLENLGMLLKENIREWKESQ